MYDLWLASYGLETVTKGASRTHSSTPEAFLHILQAWNSYSGHNHTTKCMRYWDEFASKQLWVSRSSTLHVVLFIYLALKTSLVHLDTCTFGSLQRDSADFRRWAQHQFCLEVADSLLCVCVCGWSLNMRYQHVSSPALKCSSPTWNMLSPAAKLLASSMKCVCR